MQTGPNIRSESRLSSLPSPSYNFAQLPTRQQPKPPPPPTMDLFSQPTAAATCSALSKKAQQTAARIQLTLPTLDAQDAAHQKQLSSFSTQLQQLAHHAHQLGQCVADATVVHPHLGETLVLNLTQCRDGLGMVTDSLERTVTEAGAAATGRPLCREPVVCYGGFVAAYSRLFVLGTQLLIMWVSVDSVPGVSSLSCRSITLLIRTGGQGNGARATGDAG